MRKFLAIILLVAMFAMPAASASRAKSYKLSVLSPECGIVTSVDRSTDTVTVTNLFSPFHRVRTFKGCEDWMVNDVCAMIVYKNHVIKTHYIGALEFMGGD